MRHAHDTERRTCPDCKQGWTLSAAERRFYEAKGLYVPVRCLDCRRARKILREAAADAATAGA